MIVALVQTGGESVNVVLIALGALGVNLVTIIGAVVALASRLTRIEAGQAFAAQIHSRSEQETEKDIGKLEGRIEKAEKDIHNAHGCCRDLKNLLDFWITQQTAKDNKA